MKKSKNEKIKEYHFKEIILILLIFNSELSKYNDDDLIFFAESIEGRIDILFTNDFLRSLDKSYKVNDQIINDLETIKTEIIKLYEPQWHKKLNETRSEIINIRLLAKKVLDTLHIKYIEPTKYSDQYLNINW